MHLAIGWSIRLLLILFYYWMFISLCLGSLPELTARLVYGIVLNSCTLCDLVRHYSIYITYDEVSCSNHWQNQNLIIYDSHMISIVVFLFRLFSNSYMNDSNSLIIRQWRHYVQQTCVCEDYQYYQVFPYIFRICILVLVAICLLSLFFACHHLQNPCVINNSLHK